MATSRHGWYVEQQQKRVANAARNELFARRPTFTLPKDVPATVARAFAVRLALREVAGLVPERDATTFEIETARELLDATTPDADEATRKAAREQAADIGVASLRWVVCAALWDDVRSGAQELADRALVHAALETGTDDEDQRNAARAAMVAQLETWLAE